MVDTFFGAYPVPVSNMHGMLDAQGVGSGSVTIPAGLPSSYIGLRVYFAVIASPSGSLPTFSSVAAPLEFVP